MSYEIQNVAEFLADQVYGYAFDHKAKTMSYTGFRVVATLREMFEIYDRCDGNYHSEENR